MIKLVPVILALHLCPITGQTSDSSTECGGPTTINNIYCVPNITRSDIARLRGEMNDLRSELDTLRVYSSCDHVTGGGRRNGMYWINPDPQRIQPFYAFCNFSGVRPETVINHDSMAETRFSGCEPNYCYKRRVSYSTTLQQIVALIEASNECRQFIKLRCNGVLLNHVNSDSRSSAWVSRGGQQELYWKGATSRRPNYCACGETRNCTRPQDRCNCDRNGPPETSDEGFLTDRTKLPVIELQFGDNGDRGEVGWHTLGPLICSGRQ